MFVGIGNLIGVNDLIKVITSGALPTIQLLAKMESSLVTIDKFLSIKFKDNKDLKCSCSTKHKLSVCLTIFTSLELSVLTVYPEKKTVILIFF